jgi:hypothetical protein
LLLNFGLIFNPPMAAGHTFGRPLESEPPIGYLSRVVGLPLDSSSDPPSRRPILVYRLNQGYPSETIEESFFFSGFLHFFIRAIRASDPPSRRSFSLLRISSISCLKLSPYNARLTCERGGRAWPGRTSPEGTGTAFAQAKGMTAEARQVESFCYTDFFFFIEFLTPRDLLVLRHP